jgi:hypothetical protein
MFGVIEHRFGHPEPVALDVRLDDDQEAPALATLDDSPDDQATLQVA